VRAAGRVATIGITDDQRTGFRDVLRGSIREVCSVPSAMNTIQVHNDGDARYEEAGPKTTLLHSGCELKCVSWHFVNSDRTGRAMWTLRPQIGCNFQMPSRFA